MPETQTTEQTIGSTISLLNEERIKDLNIEFDRINASQFNELKQQYNTFKDANLEIQKIRVFLGKPENILGRENTKHGEIAEVIEVNIRNARSLLEQQQPTATFEGVGRTDPTDYIIDGVHVQSKFINGINKNLSHVLDHMEKYPNFGRDGSYYQIPKDHSEIIQKIIDGKNVEGLNSKTINTAIEKMKEIEAESGRSFNEVVKPSISEYREVQKGVVFKTVDGHEKSIIERNNEIKEEIRDKANEQKESAIALHKPSWEEAGKAGVIGAIIGSTFSIATCVYKKHQEGTKLSEYSTEDWNDVGVEFGKGGIKGGVTGVAVYGITNFMDLGAPLAAAFVSASYGIGKLIKSYNNGGITKDKFVEQGEILCFETGAIALGATVGQALIPIPIVGTLIGTFASKALLSICKDNFFKETAEIERVLDSKFNAAMDRIDKAYRNIIDQIIKEYERLGEITSMAFDFKRNAVFRLDMSIKMALEYGVDKKDIIKNTTELDAFMME